MATSFEYRSVMRTTRSSSAHECEELDDILGDWGKEGWRLAHIIQQTERVQVFVFEKYNE